MKVGARKLRGKATTTKKATKKVTKPVAKKATKKAEAIAKVKAFKHKRIAIEPVPHDKLTELVKISAGPEWAKELVGKKYVNTTFAIMAIDAIDAERNIAKGAKYVGKELVQAGLTPIEATETDDEK